MSIKRLVAGRRKHAKRKQSSALQRAQLYRRFGFNLYLIRTTKRKLQIDVARSIGLSRASYVNIEAGRQSISIAQLFQLGHQHTRHSRDGGAS